MKFLSKSRFKLYQKNMLLLWECRDISCSHKTWRGKSKQVNLWHFIDCPKALRNIGTIFSKKGEGSLCLTSTDKRTDVWSRDFIIWKINSGQWAVVWAGLWNKRVWADYEQLLRPVFSLFRGQKKIKFFFDPKKVKNRASKVAHNQPRPFYFTVQPRPQPTAQN